MQEKPTLEELITFIKTNCCNTPKKKIQQPAKTDNDDSDDEYVDFRKKPEPIKQQTKKLNYQNVSVIYELPPNIAEIFNHKTIKYHHIGVLEGIQKYQNSVSFYSSILSVICQDFSMQNSKHQESIIIELITKLSSEVKNYYEIYEKKYEWTKEDLVKAITKNQIGINVMKYVSDVLCINIFVLDLKTDKINYCGADDFVPYRKNIFLIHYGEQNFEPIYSDTPKYFTCQSNLMKTIMANKHKINVYKPCQGTFKFEEYIEKEPEPAEEQEEEIEQSETSSSIHSSDIDSEAEERSKQSKKQITYTKTELKKMPLANVEAIATQLKIELKDSGKRKIKDVLIAEILEKY